MDYVGLLDTLEVGKPMIQLKLRKEEPNKLRTNRLFFKILYPLDKNKCQAVSGKCS